jgi:hypothetical protein
MTVSDEPMIEIPVARAQWMRERIAELETEVARLKAEADQAAASYTTIHVTSLNSSMAMVVCKDEEPGTVLRETDGQHREWVLGEDREWRTR